MAQATRRLAREGRALRIALHPDDLSRPGLREVTLRAIDAAIAAGARPVTYAGALGLPRTARRTERAVAERIVDLAALERTADLMLGQRAAVERATERIALTAGDRDVYQAQP